MSQNQKKKFLQEDDLIKEENRKLSNDKLLLLLQAGKETLCTVKNYMKDGNGVDTTNEMNTGTCMELVQKSMDEILEKRENISKKKTFAEKLMDVLSCEDNEDIVTWFPDGHSFVVLSQVQFTQEILPRLSKVIKYKSFVRKLYRWGFKRVPGNTKDTAFYHSKFLRDHKDLCKQMRSSNVVVDYNNKTKQNNCKREAKVVTSLSVNEGKQQGRKIPEGSCDMSFQQSICRNVPNLPLSRIHHEHLRQLSENINKFNHEQAKLFILRQQILSGNMSLPLVNIFKAL